MSADYLQHKLSKHIYRRLLILTDAWAGERACHGSLLIKCHDGGAGLPFFWSGTPDTLVSFAQVFGQDRSLYCLCGTWGVLPPSNDNIRALARYYIIEILKVQPKGPYLLGGYCDASLIVYEMARLLLEQGHEVGQLTLFDRDVTREELPLKAARRLFNLIENIIKRKQEFSEHPVACIADILSNKKNQLAVRVVAAKAKLGLIALENKTKFVPYRLAEYPGDIELIYVKWGLMGYFQFPFFQRYWRQLALGGLQIKIIAGYEHDQPNWTAVAEIIQLRLKVAEDLKALTSGEASPITIRKATPYPSGSGLKEWHVIKLPFLSNKN